MSANELQIIADFLSRAMLPEDVFGRISGNRIEQETGLKSSFRKLAKALHPDIYDGDTIARELAAKWFNELEKMRKFAEEAVAKGEYGNHEHRFPWKVPILIKGKYIVESAFKAGNICDLYNASIESSGTRAKTILKIARNSRDNDLLLTEKNTLEKIREKMKVKGAKDWPSTIPEITDSFLLDDEKTKRRVNVMEKFDGFYSAEDIKKRLPSGVDARTIAWMWKRLLILLEWTNKAGFVHGAILPPHILFYPDNAGGKSRDIRKHSIRVIDWCYSIELKSRTKLSAWIPEYKDFYAPEIIDKEPLGVYTDLYMGAKTMMHLVDAKNIPNSIYGSLLQCTNFPPAKRPQDIGKYFDEFTAILEKEYGRPKYHDFNLPS